MKEESVEVIKVHGFSLRTNTLYQVMPKFDPNAPEALKSLGSTKYLSDGIGNIEPGAIFNEYLRVWDTGMFLDSPILKSVVPDDTARKATLKEIEKHIVKPLESLTGAGTYSQTSDIWENYMIEVYDGKVFNTENPKDLLDLYLCLVDKKLTPEDKERDPEFRVSQYTIVDKESAMDYETKQVLGTIKAMGTYESLKSSNKTSLIAILRYIGINCNDKTDLTSLTISFNRYINDPKSGFKNTEAFNTAAEFYTTDKGQEIVYLFNSLKDLVASGKIKQKGSGEIILGTDIIGHNFISAAQNIQQDKKLKKDFTTFLS